MNIRLYQNYYQNEGDIMLNTGEYLSASEMNTFKSRIQAEMADYDNEGHRGRRGMGSSPYAHGSMAGFKPLNGTNVGYGDFRGAFSVTPTSGATPVSSQYAETVGYISPYFRNTAGADVGWASVVNSGTTLGQVWDIYNLLVNVLALTKLS